MLVVNLNMCHKLELGFFLLAIGFKENRESFKIPSFIIGFVLASCLFSFLQQF